MHDHFKFQGILDQCYILSRGHFLWPCDLLWPVYETNLHSGIWHV